VVTYVIRRLITAVLQRDERHALRQLDVG